MFDAFDVDDDDGCSYPALRHHGHKSVVVVFPLGTNVPCQVLVPMTWCGAVQHELYSCNNGSVGAGLK